jgi:hypothetical protein
VQVITNCAAEVALHSPPKKPYVFSFSAMPPGKLCIRLIHSQGNMYNAVAKSGYFGSKEGVFVAK